MIGASVQHTIDATGKRLGRVATEAAAHLMGKTHSTFARHRAADVTVRITNASRLSMSEKKRSSTIYTRYSGYPGGLKHTTLDALIVRKGYGEALRRAVYGMLPSNKLRARRMKRLVITE